MTVFQRPGVISSVLVFHLWHVMRILWTSSQVQMSQGVLGLLIVLEMDGLMNHLYVIVSESEYSTAIS